MKFELTNARPYAKAIFCLALEMHKLSEWMQCLDALMQIAVACEAKKFLSNPSIVHAQRLEFFQDVFLRFAESKNLVSMLSSRKKLGLLPQITFLYRQMLNDYEKVLDAEITSVCELTSEQREKIMLAMQKKHQHKILLKCKIDSRLIGGIMMRIGDRVVDGSISGKWQRLKAKLLAQD